ncbi:hypothetical protein EPIR_3595 [Erwinia piriflorinigrans CFBP 5888]|uniref:Uncharacterized protein n=1 Tax=Erwinia piriflorinigrans CFBP 5888 TaxID=1161919 RepID=V5ZC42_9GAMM|nr:hypothetical protein EPIR_3595 [Erwinia piriflorinigrans CFBP 5888]
MKKIFVYNRLTFHLTLSLPGIQSSDLMRTRQT